MLERDELIDRLNDLVHLDMDAVRAYGEAIEKIDDETQRSTLSRYRDDHERHVADLQTAVEDLGGTPEEARPDVKGFFIEGMTALRAAISPEQALKAMRQNEKLTNDRYEDAVEWETTTEIHSLLAKNLSDERRHLAWVEEQLAVTSGAERRTY